jgi:flagellum-specific ATP synthase
VFARLPALVERAGNGAKGKGSITAFYTVLTEGDDQQDPIADAARAILDGHFVLSRRIAEAGQYPAIDIEASVSRVMHEIIPKEHFELTRRFRQTLSIYQQHRDLISIGAYQRGSDPRIDQAIDLWPAMQKFLMQPIEQRVTQAEAVNALRQLFANAPPPKA